MVVCTLRYSGTKEHKMSMKHNPVVEALEDFKSHLNDWRKAIEIARDSEKKSLYPDIGDGSYWDHQLKVLNRVAKGLGIYE